MSQLGRRKRPCTECPWRVDVEPGQFPAERYEALQSTAGGPGAEVPLGGPMFACHKSAEGGEIACAGWLAVCGRDHISVRYLAAMGEVDPEALDPASDWPELFPTYDAMAEAQGA